MLLSVLDQSPIPQGSTGVDALHNTLDLAVLADQLGYHRHWVAEHHGGPMLASASPEALIGPIAAATSVIRVGSGGVMLPHYSPFKVAETFTILAALFPDRIDLGIGRAAGTDPLTTFALQRDRRQAAPDDFPQQLAELLACPATIRSIGWPERFLGSRPSLRRGCSAPRRRAPSGRLSSGCAMRSPTSSTRTAARSPRSTASGSTRSVASRRRAPRSPRGCYALRATMRRSTWRRAAG
jgi:alkanesulfonate monooxygenase SsuD/methylene tetrahydromethanopterin reductase-like flavin-dependent oxidoreductase (luciferase family)